MAQKYHFCSDQVGGAPTPPPTMSSLVMGARITLQAWASTTCSREPYLSGQTLRQVFSCEPQPYKRVCPCVGPLVRWSICPSIRPSVTLFLCERRLDSEQRMSCLRTCFSWLQRLQRDLGWNLFLQNTKKTKRHRWSNTVLQPRFVSPTLPHSISPSVLFFPITTS